MSNNNSKKKSIFYGLNCKKLLLIICLLGINLTISEKISNNILLKINKNEKKNSNKIFPNTEIPLVENSQRIYENNKSLKNSNKSSNVFLQKKISKLGNKIASKAKLNTDSSLQMKTKMKTYIKDIKEELKSNLNLPKIVEPKLDLDEETEITTDNLSTSLKLSKETIGKYTWTLLHSIASAYPLKADKTHQDAIIAFIEKM